jgi:hypothetical protein
MNAKFANPQIYFVQKDLWVVFMNIKNATLFFKTFSSFASTAAVHCRFYDGDFVVGNNGGAALRLVVR